MLLMLLLLAVLDVVGPDVNVGVSDNTDAEMVGIPLILLLDTDSLAMRV